MIESMYQVQRESQSFWVPLRGCRYHVRQWGTPGATPLVLAHGWMDVAASFQFVVDALGGNWQVIAPGCAEDLLEHALLGVRQWVGQELATLSNHRDRASAAGGTAGHEVVEQRLETGLSAVAAAHGLPLAVFSLAMQAAHFHRPVRFSLRPPSTGDDPPWKSHIRFMLSPEPA